MYIKRDKVRIKRIVLDLHDDYDVIADSKKVVVFESRLYGSRRSRRYEFPTQRQQPSLNQQLHHVNLKLSF